MRLTPSAAYLFALTLNFGCSQNHQPAADLGPGDAGIADGSLDSATDSGSPASGLGLGPELPLRTKWLFAPPDADPLAGSNLQSCALFDDEACVAGRRLRCALYDVASNSFPSEVDTLLQRALRYDRWYDLYHQPDGMSFSRQFNTVTLPGTPEAEWSKPERFQSWGNSGDAAIWSGTALVGFAARYAQTGTRADYLRMEAKARAVLDLFEVTGIPGYLARHHFLALPAGAPQSDQHVFRYDESYDHNYHTFDASKLPRMPAAYTEGVLDAQGKRIVGTPMWRGHPSIDQYSGVLSGFAAAYPLLQDEALKQQIGYQLGCYLKRLERIEVRNLQQNDMAVELVRSYFSDGTFDLDAGDVDLSQLDTLVIYALRQPNESNLETFSYGCPAEMQLSPVQVVDAASDFFLLEMLNLVGDLQSGDRERPQGISHAYANVRGGNAVQLMGAVLLAYQITGEQQYKDFLLDELIRRQNALAVADTLTTYVPPQWCRSFYGDHIVMVPLWSLISRLEASALRDRLLQTMAYEMWTKRMRGMENGKFDVLFAGEHTTHAERAAVIAEAVRLLQETGGNGDILDDPRRSYNLDRSQMLSMLPGLANETVCPTEDQQALCEEGLTILGISLPGEEITHSCGEGPGECSLPTGCAWAEAKYPLPLRYRTWGDFVWQKNPYRIGQEHPLEGGIQSAGLELTESYWLARSYGLITEGGGQVLVWRDVGGCD